MIRDKNKIYAEVNDRNTVLMYYAINIDYTIPCFMRGHDYTVSGRKVDTVPNPSSSVVICGRADYDLSLGIKVLGYNLSKPNSILVTNSIGNLTYKEVN